jgi:flagellar basal-body rod modification protein FlgD
VGGAAQPAATAAPSTQAAATNAFGLSFESLLRIILTQLTYQDPLKPMDNFEFVSQLAQFSQLQIGQTGNDKLQLLVQAQGTSQAASLLGKKVDVPAGAATLSGKVVAISFANGDPRITIETADHQTISNIAINTVSQIREGE